MAKQYEVTTAKRLVSWLMAGLARLGVGDFAVITTVGRKTGQPRRTTVSPIRDGEAVYIVSPYGQVGWVRNVRAHPSVALRQGSSERLVELTEITGERPDLVREYYQRESFARQFMDLPEDPSEEDFSRYADRFPVFRVVPTS